MRVPRGGSPRAPPLTRRAARAEALRLEAEALLHRGASQYVRHAAVATRRGGFLVFGSPVTPAFWGAFNVRRGAPLAALWAAIPDGADVVVTHGPAAGHGDWVPRKREHVGCEDLLREVRPCVSVRAGSVWWQC